MVVILQPNIFKNKTILITGAASGIGRGLAIHAASEKMNIILIDIDEEGLNFDEIFNKIKKQIGIDYFSKKKKEEDEK